MVHETQLPPPSIDFSNVPYAAAVVVSSRRRPAVTESNKRTRRVGTVVPKAVEKRHAKRLLLVEEFATAGGTDAAVFRADGKQFLAVSNSLTPDVRFRTDTIIYAFNG